MKCPYCHNLDSRVLESRVIDESTRIRRRRECCSCSKRFTTYELIEMNPMIVKKKNGSSEIFDSKKILNGILKACYKRQIQMSKIDEIVDNIEIYFQNSLIYEIDSSIIGEKVMACLKEIDEVSYVRFASVYRQFKDINSFVKDLK